MGLALHQRLQHFSLLPPIIWPLLPPSLLHFYLSPFSSYRSAFIYTTYVPRAYTYHTHETSDHLRTGGVAHFTLYPTLSCPFNYPESRMVQHRLSLMKERDREREREREAKEYRPRSSYVVVVR